MAKSAKWSSVQYMNVFSVCKTKSCTYSNLILAPFLFPPFASKKAKANCDPRIHPDSKSPIDEDDQEHIARPESPSDRNKQSPDKIGEEALIFVNEMGPTRKISWWERGNLPDKPL